MLREPPTPTLCPYTTLFRSDPDTVADLAACGKARWKIENESFNVLKNNGYHLEHNFGHGENNLSAVFVSLKDRKSTRLNSSHLVISYAVFCLKKKRIDNYSA